MHRHPTCRPWLLLLMAGAALDAYEPFPVTGGLQYGRFTGPGVMAEAFWNHGATIDTGTWTYRQEQGPAVRLDCGLYGLDAGLGFVWGQVSKFGPVNLTPYAMWGTSFGTGGIDQETRNRWGGRLHARAMFFDIGLGFFDHSGIDAVIGLQLRL